MICDKHDHPPIFSLPPPDPRQQLGRKDYSLYVRRRITGETYHGDYDTKEIAAVDARTLSLASYDDKNDTIYRIILENKRSDWVWAFEWDPETNDWFWDQLYPEEENEAKIS